MNIESSLATTSETIERVKELCEISLPGQLNLSHLPTELKKEQESYQKQMLYHLGAAAQLYQMKGIQLNENMLRWYEAAHYHSPEELIGDPSWENLYPAIVTEDKPCRSLSEAKTANESDQRFITTQLLTESISKKQKDRLFSRAQQLVCSLDPRDEEFFSKETLEECLKQEGLDSNQAINKFFSRKPYTPVTKSEKREALAKKWEERTRKKLFEGRFVRGEWEEFEWEAVHSFITLVLSSIEPVCGNLGSELRDAYLSVLRTAEEEHDDLGYYYLDPREEDTWQGLRDFAQAVKELDQDQHYYDYQDGKYTTQRWMKEVGLPLIYGWKEDWWQDIADLKIEGYERKNWECLVGEAGLTQREEVAVFYGLFKGKQDSEVRSMVLRMYWPRLEKVLKNEE